ncbi:MAG: DNA repair protein RadC [Flavobacteriales bacterium]|nr:DNA repair protein RadC [Flavobacteriales bacterium]
MNIQREHRSIRHWSRQDRPREKMFDMGAASLTDSELLAILLRSGYKDGSAVDLARKLMEAADHKLSRLSTMGVKELKQFKGMGEAKALTVMAAMELGRRRRLAGYEEFPAISGSSDAFDLIAPVLEDLSHEEFWVLFLNRANRMIAKASVSRGGVSGTVADPKIIFKLALEHLACGVILCHNHPSGNVKPSNADKILTEKLKAAGHFLEIQVLDHLIIGGHAYFSFADEGLL